MLEMSREPLDQESIRHFVAEITSDVAPLFDSITGAVIEIVCQHVSSWINIARVGPRPLHRMLSPVRCDFTKVHFHTFSLRKVVAVLHAHLTNFF